MMWFKSLLISAPNKELCLRQLKHCCLVFNCSLSQSLTVEMEPGNKKWKRIHMQLYRVSLKGGISKPEIRKCSVSLQCSQFQIDACKIFHSDL